MEIKEAAQLAKGFALDLFRDEGIRDPRLEEVAHDEGHGLWHVTVSFLRAPPEGATGIAAFVLQSDRSFKTITIAEETQTVVSIQNRA